MYTHHGDLADQDLALLLKIGLLARPGRGARSRVGGGGHRQRFLLRGYLKREERGVEVALRFGRRAGSGSGGVWRGYLPSVQCFWFGFPATVEYRTVPWLAREAPRSQWGVQQSMPMRKM